MGASCPGRRCSSDVEGVYRLIGTCTVGKLACYNVEVSPVRAAVRPVTPASLQAGVGGLFIQCNGLRVAGRRYDMLYIHIGAEKTGSSSIQSFMVENSTRLADAGTLYPTIGRASPRRHNQVRRDAELPGSDTGSSLSDLREYCLANADKKIIISDELLSLTSEAGVEHIARIFAGIDARIVFYFRDYASFLVSLYNQDTKTGVNTLDFDQFFEQRLARPSQFDLVSRWGERFGWDRMVVRLFDRGTLVNNDAVDDFLRVIGCEPLAGQSSRARRLNVSQGWRATEILRSVCAGIHAEMGTRGRRVPRALEEACRAAVYAATATSADSVEYMTTDQRIRADEATMRDVAALNARLSPPGLPIPALTPRPGREFVPGIEFVPAAVVAEAMARAVVALGSNSAGARSGVRKPRQRGTADAVPTVRRHRRPRISAS